MTNIKLLTESFLYLLYKKRKVRILSRFFSTFSKMNTIKSKKKKVNLHTKNYMVSLFCTKKSSHVGYWIRVTLCNEFLSPEGEQCIYTT